MRHIFRLPSSAQHLRDEMCMNDYTHDPVFFSLSQLVVYLPHLNVLHAVSPTIIVILLICSNIRTSSYTPTQFKSYHRLIPLSLLPSPLLNQAVSLTIQARGMYRFCSGTAENVRDGLLHDLFSGSGVHIRAQLDLERGFSVTMQADDARLIRGSRDDDVDEVLTDVIVLRSARTGWREYAWRSDEGGREIGHVVELKRNERAGPGLSTIASHTNAARKTSSPDRIA